MKKFISFLAYFLLVTTIFAQQVMHLGSTEFVKPSAQMAVAKRCITVKTAVRGARVFARVGGVAFIQEALPAGNFDFNSISLNCNEISQTCSVVIDGKSYAIPLSSWMLQPIVNFANDTCNAVVTLYGENDAKIMYHPAFVDKLLGLRLLQTDMMLASNRLKIEDRSCLPEDESNTPILANSEKKSYERIDKENQKNAIIKTELLMEEQMYEYGLWDTYIYTDRDQKIEFSVDNGNFSITGEPYYLFSKRFFERVDTVSFNELSNAYKNIYKRYSNECKSLAKISTEYKLHSINSMTSLAEEKKIALLPTNELITLYWDADTLKKKAYNKLIIETYDKMSSTIDEVFKVNNNFKKSDGDVAFVMQKVKDYKDKLDWLSLPFVKKWSDLLLAVHPKSNAARKLSNSLSNYYFSNKYTYLFYMQLNRLPYTEEKTMLSSKIRENQLMVRAMNPIVYNAAIATCQWSAFFRYMKKHNPSNWNSFIQKVNKLQYNAPQIWTPIDCTIYK